MPKSVSTTSPSTTAAARGTANVVAALGAGTVGATAGKGGVLTAAAGCAGVAVREASGRGVSCFGSLSGDGPAFVVSRAGAFAHTGWSGVRAAAGGLGTTALRHLACGARTP